MEEQKKKKLYKKLRNKYRLVILNDATFEERFSFRLSPLNVFTYFGSISLFLIIGVTLLIAFTPLREYIPGYTDVELRQNVMQLLFKTDSLENQLAVKDKYLERLRLIMQGKPPDTLYNEAENKPVEGYAVVDMEKSSEDSMLRAYVESEDNTNLTLLTNYQNGPDISNFVFFTPLAGTITNEFNMNQNHFGVDIVADENESVKATLEGTVIFSEWTTETGYVIHIQHPNNLVSIYKHNSVLLKKSGDFVKDGEVIAIIGNSGELTTGPHLHFELWYNGNPLNPQDYMLF